MTAYEVRYRGRVDFDRSFLVDASGEDEADEQAYDQLKLELAAESKDINVLDVDIRVTTKDEVEA